MDVSRETQAQLEAFAALLLKWNRRINLVAPGDAADIRARHVEDCLQLAGLIRSDAGRLADLGSGGGLPGLVIAIARPDLRVTCVESDLRKAAFLREAARALRLDVDVRTKRIEALAPLAVPVVTARGLAPLPALLGHVARHLAPDGTALLMKGRKWQEELERARASWHFSVEAAPSRTNPDAVILSIGGVCRA